MITRRLALGIALITLVVVASRALPREAAPKRPNVLLIVWDTVRADHLSLYGHDRATTPWLDHFAEDATVFDRAVSPEMWTPPSHASLFTGFAPQHHGVKATYKWLDGAHVTLAETLAGEGFQTFAFSANPYVAPDTNLTQGFETIATTFSAPLKHEARRITHEKLIAEDASTDMSPAWKGKRRIGEVQPYKDAGPLAVETLAKWLDGRRPDAPFFAFVNLMEAHIPRIPSLASRKALLDDETIATGLATEVSQIDLLAYTFGKKEYTPDQLDAIEGVYDAAVRDLDVLTSAIVEELRARGLLDDTIVVITADHGENLGDHHAFGHKFSLWDSLLHVPLVIRAPGRMAPGRVTTPVSNLAVYATILDLLGVAPPPPGPDLGTSLARATAPSALFSELVESTPVSIARIDREYGLFDKSWWLRRMQSVEEDGWKLVEASDGSRELYHVAEDADEATDLSGAEPVIADRLHARLAAWDAATPDYDPDGRTEHDKAPKLDRRAKDMLATLGYLDNDPTTDSDVDAVAGD